MGSPSVLIGVYDPYGMPAGFYFGTINSDLEFSTSFLVKNGVNFKIDGTYSIKAHYAESEAKSFFEYYEILPEVIDEVDEPIEESTEGLKKKVDEPNVEVSTDTTTTEEIIDDDKTENSDSINESSIVIDSQKPTSTPDDTEIIKTVSEETSVQTVNSENKVKTINEKNNSKKIESNIETKKQNNLTVEDIELGLLLNQINLECDSSTFTDTISYYDGMGPALYRLCKFDSSLNFFNESLVENPNDVEVLVNKGSTLGKLGYFSEAIVYYDQAINIDPEFFTCQK